jgi:non-lysosomal glucosylceramidase
MEKIKRWDELEDWVEFYKKSELTHVDKKQYRLLANFGGPGSSVPYLFFARVEKGCEQIISHVFMNKHDFIYEPELIEVKGCPDNFSWIKLGYTNSQRDYNYLTIELTDRIDGLDRICSVQILDRLESGEIERRISYEDNYGVEPLSGVPLGGIGSGKLELCSDGVFRNITINGNIDTPIWRSESSFFALHVETLKGGQGRLLTKENLFGLPAFKNIEYSGIYPQALIKYDDPPFPVSIETKAFGSIIPGNEKDSSLPTAMFKLTLTNKTNEKISTKIAFSMENFLGRGGSVASVSKRKTFDEGYYNLWDERAGNYEELIKSQHNTGILYTGGEKTEKRSAGEYFIASPDCVCDSLLGWSFENDPAGFWQDFIDTGIFPDNTGKKSKGEKTAAALVLKCDLEANQSKEVHFVFCWYTPCFWQAGNFDYSHFYCNNFSSAKAVSDYVLDNFDRLEKESGEVGELLLKSSLPEWFAKSLCNDAYVTSTDSWLTKDGRFSMNEGASHMFGCMGTIDQKLYANHYLSLFFPEIDKRELLAFARAQGENGGIQHDLGYGHIDQSGKPHHWPDLSSALCILSLKHFLLTGDNEYLDEVYPVLVKALLEYQLGLDTDGDAIPNISGVGNTFDAEEFEGTSSYIASLWLAALKTLAFLADLRNDSATASTAREIFKKAKKHAIAQLWNGKYFVNYYDSNKKQRCPNCHISQLAGEFFSEFLGLGSCYGYEYTVPACKSTLELNYPQAMKAPMNEATPEGEMPYRKLWGWLFHTKIFIGALPIIYDMHSAGMKTLERLEYLLNDINHDNRWDQRLFFEPETGRQHWGRFYMSSPASWYVYQTLVGYFYNKPLGQLSIIPRLSDSMTTFKGPVFLPDFWLWVEYERNTFIHIKMVKALADDFAINELIIPAIDDPAVYFNDQIDCSVIITENNGAIKIKLNALSEIHTITIKSR